MISIIAAMTSRGVIGFQNKLPPWKVPADMKRFKRLTTGHPVIMGRKTFESMGKALSDRSNVVLTRSGLDAPGCITADSLQRAIEDIRIMGCAGHEEIFIIGGEKVYQEALDRKIADRIYLTVVYDDFPGDAFFPLISGNEWEAIGLQAHEIDEKNLHHYDFLIYRRRRR